MKSIFSSALSRREKFVAVLFFLVTAAIQFGAFPTFFIGGEHDDALYVLAAESLAKGSYHFDFFIGRPAITILTPGLPILLLPVAKFFSMNTLAYQFVMLAFLLLCDIAVWIWLRRSFSSMAALGMAALFGTSAIVLFRAGAVMPEIPYLLLSLLILSFWDRPDPLGWKLGSALAFLYLIRPAGVTLIAAMGIVLLASRQWKRLIGAMGLPLVAFLAWSVWSKQTGGVQENLELAKNYSEHPIQTAFAILSSNFKMAGSVGYSFLPPGFNSNTAYVVLGCGLILLTLFVSLWKTYKSKATDPNAVYFIFLIGMHAFWPWWYDRYMIPLLPFVLMYSFGWLDRWKKPSLWLLVAVVPFSLQGWRWVAERHFPMLPPYQESYRWIKNNTEPLDIFASELQGREVLYTGRIMSSMPHENDLEIFVQKLNQAKVKYVVWEDHLDFGLALQAEAPVNREMATVGEFLKNDSEFEPVYRSDPEKMTIYKVK